MTLFKLVVVGFHHIEGNQIEFVYPSTPALPSDAVTNLPFLALPDGVHLHDSDHMFFTLPKSNESTAEPLFSKGKLLKYFFLFLFFFRAQISLT